MAEIGFGECESPLLDGKPLEADLIVMAAGAWMGDLFPRTVKPISVVVGVNVLYTSTPDGSTELDQETMPCWIDHGEGSFGLPSVEGSGVKAAVVTCSSTARCSGISWPVSGCATMRPPIASRSPGAESFLSARARRAAREIQVLTESGKPECMNTINELNHCRGFFETRNDLAPQTLIGRCVRAELARVCIAVPGEIMPAGFFAAAFAAGNRHIQRCLAVSIDVGG